MPIIHVSMLEGRTKAQKTAAAAALTAALVEHLGSRPGDVTVVFDEKPRENWAIAGKLLATD